MVPQMRSCARGALALEMATALMPALVERGPGAGAPGRPGKDSAGTAVLPFPTMDTLGIEPRASRMLSGCDTTTPRAR